MRLLFGLMIMSMVFFSCNNGDKTPDVSNIKVELTTQRFERDLFKMDTTNIIGSLTALQSKYPVFLTDFSDRILGIEKPEEAGKNMSTFINSYNLLYDTTQLLFPNMSKYENEIKSGLQFVKYYFPTYKLPTQIITFIGPMDASFKSSFGLQGDILSGTYIGIGLQLHMGKNFSFYQSQQGQDLYPSYISNRYEPNTIATNCMKNIVDDLFPEKLEDKTLVQQMIEKGKRLYVLTKLLPHDDEYKLIGYTAVQLKDCYTNEQRIWDMFVQNNLLQNIDENIIKNYIGEGPKTQELGDESPGNIGAFSGWQIVKKYMSKNDGINLQKLMATDDDTVLQEAKYKP